MGTSCKIGYKKDDGLIQFTRVNWDGYPEYVGKQLLKFYNTEDKAKQIASSKEIRSIMDCGLPEFYDDSRNSEVADLNNFINRSGNEDYGYLWKDGCWYLLNKENKTFDLLQNIIDKKQNE